MKKLLLIMMAVALSACSSDDDEPGGNDAISFAARQAVTWDNGTTTRAGEPDIDAYPIENIGVYAYANSSGSITVFDNQPAETADNGATYTYTPEKLWNPLQYKFFAYSPHSSINATTVAAIQPSYSSFASLRWTGLPGFTEHDLMVAAAMVERDNRDNKNRAVVPFDMSHVYARIRFKFMIGEHYDDMREIRIKKLEVLQAGNIMSVDLLYTPAIGSSPATTSWDNQQMGVSNKVELKPDKTLTDGVLTLKKNSEGYKSFASVYVFPQQTLASVKVRMTYDVYDNEEYSTEQILVREDEMVESVINFRDAISLAPGKYYDLNVKIEPRFIYMITDTDQFDDIVIIK